MSLTRQNDHLKRQASTLTSTAFVWFCRIIAVYCLYAAVNYWIQLIGLNEGVNNRFDTMPVHWQIAAAALAVLFPVAATGLWMVVSWGPVIWAVAALAETAMYFVYPNLYGERPAVLMAHAAVAVLYVAFRLALYLEERKRGN